MLRQSDSKTHAEQRCAKQARERDRSNSDWIHCEALSFPGNRKFSPKRIGSKAVTGAGSEN
jgi:hypothetical protein